MEKTLDHIHELNLLLNSNMVDAMQAAKDSKHAIHDIVKELDALNQDTEKGLSLAKEEMVAQLRQLETNLNNQMVRLSDKSLHKLDSDRQEAMRLLKKDYNVIIQTLKEQLEQMTRTFKMASSENASLQKESVARIGGIIEGNAEVTKTNQKKLTEKLSELNQGVIANNEALNLNLTAILGKLDEQTKLFRKSQRKWFIWLLVLIILGYFF